MKFSYFDEKEICNPILDSCPANCLEELPPKVRTNICFVLNLLSEVREQAGFPFLLTSTWRPNGRKESAHFDGKAVDFQIREKEEKWQDIMNILKNLPPKKGFRAILEWRYRRHWVHLDRNFRDHGENVLMVAYPNHKNPKYFKKMIYESYIGIFPRSMV